MKKIIKYNINLKNVNVLESINNKSILLAEIFKTSKNKLPRNLTWKHTLPLIPFTTLPINGSSKEDLGKGKMF